MKRMLLLIAVLALVAAACGGSAGADEGVASLDGSTQLESAATTAAPELTRDEGFDVEDPTVDSEGNLRLARPAEAQEEGFDREAYRAAREACDEFLENVSLGFRDEDRTEIEDQLLEFAACVRENGYDMPDPEFSGTPGQGGGGGPFGDIDREDPAFQAAAEACQDVLPGGGGAGGLRGGGGAGDGN